MDSVTNRTAGDSLENIQRILDNNCDETSFSAEITQEFSENGCVSIL